MKKLVLVGRECLFHVGRKESGGVKERNVAQSFSKPKTLLLTAASAAFVRNSK